MKKPLATVLLGILLALPTFAEQTTFGIKYGVSTGGASGTAISDDFDFINIGLDNLGLGYSFGGFMKMPLTQHLYFIPELNISVHRSKGAHDEDIPIYDPGSGMTGTTIAHYELFRNTTDIEIPLLLRYETQSGFNVYGGGYVAFNLESDIHMEVTLLNSKNKLDFESDNAAQFGYSLGMGWTFDRLSLDLRYTQSLTDSVRNLRTDSSESFSNTFRDYHVELGMRYRL